MNELGRLHKIIKDYVKADNEHTGRVAKALKFSLQEKMNSYYVYVNKWVGNIFIFEWSKIRSLEIIHNKFILLYFS